MSRRRGGQSIEQQVAIAVIAATLVAAVAAVGVTSWSRARAAGADAQDNAAVDAIVSAMEKKAAPQPLLDALVSAGTVRAAVVYDAQGATLASSGRASGSAEQVCRSLAGGGSVCVQAREAAGRVSLASTMTSSMPSLMVALLAGAVVASIATTAIRSRFRTLRVSIDDAIRDQTYATRVMHETGSLSHVTSALNQLLEQMQTRDVALRRRTGELEAANKDLESFAAAVSHDLRAPLGSIAGFAQALDEDYRERLDDVGRECVYWIRESASQMSKLIEGLLQMARLSRIEMQRTDVDITTMARQIAGSLQHAQPERDVDFAIADHVVANGDERLLHAVLENLIANAWKFTSKLPRARIEVGMRNDAGTPAIYVRDNGAGFDPQHAAKMFRPFQRLHSEKEFAGTGIGLATVYKIVQRHGGRAWAEGEPGRGATIYFTTTGSGAAA